MKTKTTTETPRESRYYRCPKCDKLILFRDEVERHKLKHHYDEVRKGIIK